MWVAEESQIANVGEKGSASQIINFTTTVKFALK